MEMTFRWYGSKFDTVTLEQIRQIPGVTGVITTLYDTTPGEVWTREAIHALKEEVEASGLHISGIESVNIHDAIKIGSPDREQYIDNYIETLKHLGEEDIHLVCYNFMPVFDWTRTELARVRPDGSTVLAYKQSAVDALVPEKMFESIAGDANGAILPGWEPERMAKVKELFDAYRDVDDEKLFANLKYFLERIMPVCNEYDIRMAIHPDDPAWSVFGLPRIIINRENILRMMKMVDDPHNGVTFCSGSYGTNLENDLLDMIRYLAQEGYILRYQLYSEASSPEELMDETMDEDDRESTCRAWRFAQRYKGQYAPGFMAGWDIGRAAMLTRWGCYLGWITESEAVGILWDLSQKVVEELHSWREFAQSYLFGGLMWKLLCGDSSAGSYLGYLADAATDLLTGKAEQDNGQWRDCPWPAQRKIGFTL